MFKLFQIRDSNIHIWEIRYKVLRRLRIAPGDTEVDSVLITRHFRDSGGTFYIFCNNGLFVLFYSNEAEINLCVLRLNSTVLKLLHSRITRMGKSGSQPELLVRLSGTHCYADCFRYPGPGAVSGSGLVEIEIWSEKLVL